MNIQYGVYVDCTINHAEDPSSSELLMTGSDPFELRAAFNKAMNTREMGIIYGSRPKMPDYSLETFCSQTIEDLDEYRWWEFMILPILDTKNTIKLSDWINDKHCSFRIIEGGDPENIADRVCFIEKTPRIRVAPYDPDLSNYKDSHKWLSGPKGSSGYGEGDGYGQYPPSRKWANTMLARIGYNFNE